MGCVHVQTFAGLCNTYRRNFLRYVYSTIFGVKTGEVSAVRASYRGKFLRYGAIFFFKPQPLDRPTAGNRMLCNSVTVFSNRLLLTVCHYP